MALKKCESCFGTGIDRLRSGFVKVPCPVCNGTGYVEVPEEELDTEKDANENTSDVEKGTPDAPTDMAVLRIKKERMDREGDK